MQPSLGVTRVPRTFGILSIVFAGLVLFTSLFGLMGLVVPLLLAHAPPPPRPADAQMAAFISRVYTTMGGLSAVLSVMSAGLLALGIGQLRYRRWAALWSVRWAIVALGVVVIMADLVATTFSRSLFDVVAYDARMPTPAAHEVGRALGIMYAATTTFFYAPYPILLMIFFSRRQVRAAMTG